MHMHLFVQGFNLIWLANAYFDWQVVTALDTGQPFSKKKCVGVFTSKNIENVWQFEKSCFNILKKKIHF